MGSRFDKHRRQYLFDKQNSRCFWCGRSCRLSSKDYTPPNKLCFTIDHVVPRSRGGPDTYANIVGACSQCNSARDWIETKLSHRKKPPFIVKAQYLPVGFLKFSVQKKDTQER